MWRISNERPRCQFTAPATTSDTIPATESITCPAAQRPYAVPASSNACVIDAHGTGVIFRKLACGAQNPKPKKIHSTTADNAQFLIVFSGLWSTACIPHQIELKERAFFTPLSSLPSIYPVCNDCEQFLRDPQTAQSWTSTSTPTSWMNSSHP